MERIEAAERESLELFASSGMIEHWSQAGG
jgi:hypothetical protein